MNDDNFILATDAYKETHWLQYPKDTRHVYSYLESRGGAFDETVFFGLQYYLKKYLCGQVIFPWMLDDAEEFLHGVFGHGEFFNRAGWEYIISKYGGRLPVKIKAVPEGMIIPTRNVLMTIENTDSKVPWLTNFLETMLMNSWYPITVCTLSYKIKKLIANYAKFTGGQVTPFHLNDFGYRGTSSQESAGIGGMAHLVNFAGTDTLKAINYAKEFYGAINGVGMSVMATEHSTTTIYGKDHEFDAYRYFINACPEGILSVVSDSFNIYEAIKFFGTELREIILARGKKTGFAKFVVRPDSGDPPQMSKECLDLLWQYFGGTVNEKGYKVLNPKVGVIYGDGINYDSIDRILETITDAKYCVSNMVFGMGGALLQQVNRDTQKFAFKCCAANIGDKWVDVYKDPVTDKGKVSKRGRLKLVKNEWNGYDTRNENAVGDDILETVFENGRLIKEYTFDEVRKTTGTWE